MAGNSAEFAVRTLEVSRRLEDSTKGRPRGWGQYHRDGTGVTAPLISDSGATYTPGVSERRNGVSTFLNAGLKDVAKQTDISGNVTATRKYDAYGMVIGATGTWKGPFGYSGSAGYQEDETGLQLLGHRYYDSSTGRFITRDPIKDGRNWYGYCDNNPVNAVDADGLKKKLIIILGDTSGLEQQALWIVRYIKEHYSDEYDIEIRRPKSHQQAEDLMVEADAIILVGHGSETTGPTIAGKGFGSDRLRNVRDRRKKAGKKKMDFAHILSCSCLAKGEWKALWASIASEVLGSEGWVIPATYADGGRLKAYEDHPKPIIIRSPKPPKTSKGPAPVSKSRG